MLKLERIYKVYRTTEVETGVASLVWTDFSSG